MKLKRTVLTLGVLGLLLGGSLSASAESTPANAPSLQALITQLQNQLNALRAKQDALNAAKTEVRQAAGEVKDTAKLISQLREGASGEDVKLLQIVLASDPSVYPEGRVTGFYGKLTSHAVKRFQKKHGLAQVGNVGPQTFEKINEALHKNPIAKEKNSEGEHCAIVPPGHLIAPGWLRKQGGVKPIVPVCQTLPPGILKKLDGSTTTPPTSTPDTTAPVISQVAVTGITYAAAHVTWMTNEAATGKVWYSLTSPVATSGLSAISAALTLNHDLALTGLAASTTYYYVVESSDAAGNKSMGSQSSFTTLTVPDMTAPVLSGIMASSTTASSTHILWTTNEAGTSKIWYGVSTPIATDGAPGVASTDFVLNHDFTLSNLNASTTYYYVVYSADAAGNASTSSQYTFATLQ